MGALDRFKFWDRTATEVESFTETFSARPGLAPRKPPRGSAIIEVFSDEGEVIAIDTIEAPAAPRGSFRLDDGTPATFVVHGDDRALQELRVDVSAALPFDIPAFLRSKPGAASLRISWSCDA